MPSESNNRKFKRFTSPPSSSSHGSCNTSCPADSPRSDTTDCSARLPRRARASPLAPPSDTRTTGGDPATGGLTRRHRACRVESHLPGLPRWPDDRRCRSHPTTPAPNQTASSTRGGSVIVNPTSAINPDVDAHPSMSHCRTLRRPRLTRSPADDCDLRAGSSPHHSPRAAASAPPSHRGLQRSTPSR